MNKKELKQIVKNMVHESLLEIFAEMHLETIIENVMNGKSKDQNMIYEQRQATVVVPKQPKLNNIETKKSLKENLIKKMGVSESEWQSIYSDIDPASVPSDSSENPEFTTEDDLRRLGLLK